MGELMDVLAPALSSVRRPKSHYRGRRLEADRRPQESGVRAHNETLFLLNLLAYEVLHAGRCVMERATGTESVSLGRTPCRDWPCQDHRRLSCQTLSS